MKNVTMIMMVALFAFLSACSNQEEPEVYINELNTETVYFEETILINNCGGKANSEQSVARNFSTTVTGEIGLSAGYKAVAEGSLTAKYSQYQSVAKTQRLTAPPGTNMKIILRWSEELRTGSVTADGQPGTYEVRIPIAVDQISSEDLGCSTGVAPALPPGQPESNEAPVQEQESAPVASTYRKGELLHECTFDSDCGWYLEEGVSLVNGNLVIDPGYDAVLWDGVTYTDFVFETKFLFPSSGSFAFYMRHQRPACEHWNCSIQIALYPQEVVARRYLGDQQNQQYDIIKNRSFRNISTLDWNTIVIVVDGGSYQVYINDMLVLEFVDATYISGSFIVDNAPTSNTDVNLDYIRIYKLQ